MGPRKGKGITSKISSQNNAIKILSEKKEERLGVECNISRPPSNFSTERKSLKKKQLTNLIKDEFAYISNLFDVLDIAHLNHGRRNIDEEEDSSENLPVLDIPEKKTFKKQKSKSTSQSSKFKSFPHTIEGLEKELDELKGTPMTYLKKLRKKGLQSRLIKKRRREEFKQKKTSLKQGKKPNSIVGPAKSIKSVFNNDGNVVSNKFDFADSEIKKDNKRKPVSSFIDASVENKILKTEPQEKTDFGKCKIENKDLKGTINQGPVFNKDNKMVFSKVIIPDMNDRPRPKKKTDKDPKKILQKIKENSKKLSELEKEHKDKANSIKEKQKWAAALKRASGEKVKDDPELLKKTITKEKNKKMQSQKKWQARIDRVQKEKDDRQKKRTENIQARKSEKKKRKMKKAVKRGSYVQV